VHWTSHPIRVRDYQSREERKKRRRQRLIARRPTRAGVSDCGQVGSADGGATLSRPPRRERTKGFFEKAEYLAVRQHLTLAVYQDVLDFA